MTTKNTSETKAERFKRVASRRTQNVLEAIRKLGNCSNKGIYQYGSDEAAKIFHAIDNEIKRIKMLYAAKSNSSTFNL